MCLNHVMKTKNKLLHIILFYTVECHSVLHDFNCFVNSSMLYVIVSLFIFIWTLLLLFCYLQKRITLLMFDIVRMDLQHFPSKKSRKGT